MNLNQGAFQDVGAVGVVTLSAWVVRGWHQWRAPRHLARMTAQPGIETPGNFAIDDSPSIASRVHDHEGLAKQANLAVLPLILYAADKDISRLAHRATK